MHVTVRLLVVWTLCKWACKYTCVWVFMWGCVYLRGSQLQSKNPQCCLSLHFSLLAVAAADARGRCASVSSPAGHLGVNRWKPGQPIQKNSLSDCRRSLCLPWLQGRPNAKSVLPISHFQSFLPPPVCSKPADIESPGREGRKFGQRKYRNYLLKEREGTAKWKLQRGNTKHSLDHGPPPAPSPLHNSTYDLNLRTVLTSSGLCLYTHTRQRLAAVAQYIARSKYFDILENNLSKAEVKSIHCVKF